MRQLVFITLTTTDGETVHVEHRQIRSVLETPNGTWIAGYFVVDSWEEILARLEEVYKKVEGL